MIKCQRRVKKEVIIGMKQGRTILLSVLRRSSIPTYCVLNDKKLLPRSIFYAALQNLQTSVSGLNWALYMYSTAATVNFLVNQTLE